MRVCLLIVMLNVLLQASESILTACHVTAVRILHLFNS